MQNEASQKLEDKKKNRTAPETNYFSKAKRDAFSVACNQARENAQKETPARSDKPPNWGDYDDKDSPDMDDD
ncbi:MAG: hypothetical protein FWF76_02790 [Oscillospiraceae bacterium]|nr:hypothetical protein [Oscillospiraceae bacterium]